MKALVVVTARIEVLVESYERQEVALIAPFTVYTQLCLCEDDVVPNRLVSPKFKDSATTRVRKVLQFGNSELYDSSMRSLITTEKELDPAFDG